MSGCKGVGKPHGRPGSHPPEDLLRKGLFVPTGVGQELGLDEMHLHFTDRQLDVMNILWERESATVREAKEEMADDLAYTSVLTVFQTLEKNGHVDYEQEGKAYRYYPTVSRKEAGAAAVQYLLRQIFPNAPAALLEAILDVRRLSQEEHDELRAVLTGAAAE